MGQRRAPVTCPTPPSHSFPGSPAVQTRIHLERLPPSFRRVAVQAPGAVVGTGGRCRQCPSFLSETPRPPRLTRLQGYSFGRRTWAGEELVGSVEKLDFSTLFGLRMPRNSLPLFLEPDGPRFIWFCDHILRKPASERTWAFFLGQISYNKSMCLFTFLPAFTPIKI